MALAADYCFHAVTDITAEFLQKEGIKALLLDIDNTLTLDHSPLLPNSSRDWLEQMKAAGVGLCILSNNVRPERVRVYAALCGVPFVTAARKPLPDGARRGCALLKTKPRETAVVGDQFFTDMLAARFSGCRAVLVDYFEKEHSAFFALKRFAEKPFVAAARRERTVK